MRPPRVTVLTSVHNDERFVAEAIRSILDQTFADFEFLVINDASTDRTRDIVASFGDPRIRIVDNEQNLGLTRSLNRGLRLARGELVARFDGNDRSRRERLARQVAFLDAHLEVAVVGSQMRWIDTTGRPMQHTELARPMTADGIDFFSMFDSPIAHPASMFRTAVVRDELHGYDEAWRVGQDADLWFRVGARHRLANLPDVLLDYRIDPDSISGNLQSPLRAGHTERWTRLSHEAMKRYLRSDDVPRDWAAKWVRVNDPAGIIDPAAAAETLAALEAVVRRFFEIRPGALRNEEVRRQAAAIRSRVTFRLLRDGHRVASLPTFFAVARADRRFALGVLPKYAALFFIGRRAPKLWRRIRR